jgi:prepilin-type N-terminal cleavage/methylation domain-containing protein
MHTKIKPARGFTLMELLVVVAIIAILCSIAFPVFQSVTRRAQMAREVQAGRSLITAFNAAAADRDGVFLAGYDRTVTEVALPDGSALSGVPAQRYPFRLAPYFSNRMDGTVLINDNAKQIDSTNNYLVSCYPALGMNYLLVGGDISATGVNTYPDECVTRMVVAAFSPLVFASACGDGSRDGLTDKVRGYCILTPPHTTSQIWSTANWTKSAAAGAYGNVDGRYAGKAVSVFLDGSVRLLSIAELRDMRLWSRNAAAQDNANYNIPRASGGRL